MISNNITVDNVALSDLGVVLAPDSYKSVLQFPSLKSVKVNDWAEYDYIEPDLDSPTLDKRTVTLNFHANGIDGYERFIAYLERKSLFTWNFAELGVVLPLRIESNGLKHTSRKWQSFSVSFVDDAPYHPDGSVIVSKHYGGGGFVMDGVPLDYYGVFVLDGTLEKIRQIGKVKDRLTVSENSRDGAVYDYGGSLKTASNDIQIKCLIRAANMPTLINNYYALLNRLKSPHLRRIFVTSTMEVIECYYKSATCEDVHLHLASGAAGIAFTLTMTVVNKGVMRVLGDDADDYYLTDGSGKFLAP